MWIGILSTVAVSALIAGCGGDSDDSASSSGSASKSASGDTGATITMWTRAATETQSERLVKAYNASHKNQVEADRHPDRRLPGQRRRGGRRQGPAGPVRLRRRVRAELHVAGALPRHHRPDRRAAVQGQARARAHAAGTFEDKQVHRPAHARPVGAVLQQGPLQEGRPRPGEAADDAEGVRRARPTIRDKLGGDTYGTYFGGNCGGCFVFTFWPSVWAGGGDVMNEDGTEQHDRRPADGGDVRDLQPARQGRRRARRRPRTRPARRGSACFPKGKIGIMPMPSTTLGLMPQGHGHRRRADPRA